MNMGEVLKRVETLCTEATASRTRLYFGLGQCVMDLHPVKRHGWATRQATPDTDAMGAPLYLVAAIRKIRTFIVARGYDVPMADRYWSSAARASIEYTAEEREALIKHGISWDTVRTLLAEDDNGHATIAKLIAGKITKITRNRVLVHKEAFPRSPQVGGSAPKWGGQGNTDSEDLPAIQIPIPRDAQDEDFQMALKSLVTQVHQGDLATGLKRAILEAKRNRYGERLTMRVEI
jgi:hypothetical protein